MQTTKNEAAKAAYSFYREIIDSLSVGGGVSSLSFDELNELYNIVLRAQKDEEFEKALAACDDLSAKNLPISEKINKLLSEYSAAHGVDIREELYEIKGAQGTIYFKAQTGRDNWDRRCSACAQKYVRSCSNDR